MVWATSIVVDISEHCEPEFTSTSSTPIGGDSGSLKKNKRKKSKASLKIKKNFRESLENLTTFGKKHITCKNYKE